MDACPACGKSIDRHACADGTDNKPKPGDLSVCIGCSALLRFGKHGELKLLSQTALKNLPTEDRAALLAAQEHVRKFGLGSLIGTSAMRGKDAR